jgi:succinate dehydrogenase / fumarate reductase flavoprotein subunit
MQGLADGYFVLPYTIGDYLARHPGGASRDDHTAFREVEEQVRQQSQHLLDINGRRTVDTFHRELGQIMWNECGMARTAEGLKRALTRIPELRDEFWNDVRVGGGQEDLNQSLEKAGRVADFFEFAELMVRDALHRNESCGGHFREESQTAEGEALRNDNDFSYVAAWEYGGPNSEPALHKETLHFEYVQLAQRSYK